MPHTVKCRRGPKLRAHRSPSMVAMPMVSMVARRRDSRYSSMKYVMEISLMDMVEVSDARNSRKKNSMDQNIPP